jgi:hypothetical protein
LKALTCRDLGGACDEPISGETFEEIGQKCRAHVMDAVKSGDAAHKSAVDRMMAASPAEQAASMADYRKKFDALSTPD